MNNYLIMIIAFILGQLGYASVSIYNIQRSLPSITYWQAVQQYTKKEFGSFVMAACGWAIVMFIASDWIDFSIDRKDLLTKEVKTLQDKLIIAFRTVATALGALIQHILYVALKKGKKAIHDYAQKNSIDDNIQ